VQSTSEVIDLEKYLAVGSPVVRNRQSVTSALLRVVPFEFLWNSSSDIILGYLLVKKLTEDVAEFVMDVLEFRVRMVENDASFAPKGFASALASLMRCCWKTSTSTLGLPFHLFFHLVCLLLLISSLPSPSLLCPPPLPSPSPDLITFIPRKC